MRHLITVLLILWLPFQATAALGMAACTGHDLQHLISVASAPGESGGSTPDRHSAQVEAVADGCSQGAQCTLQCVQILGGNASTPDLRMARNAPIRHLLKHIAQVPPEAIHRPPIALAA